MNRTIIPIACVLAPKSAQMWNNGYVLSHFAFVKPETLSSGGREKMSSAPLCIQKKPCGFR